MGWTVLYIAFGIVALWLLGEVLLQYKARLRWRLLAFTGFVGVVIGVLMPSVPVIALGAIAFATGQTYVTLSFRRGFSTGWAIGGSPGESRRRRAGAEREPTLQVSDLEMEYGHETPAPPAAAPLSGPAAVYEPEPLPDDTGQYGIYTDPRPQQDQHHEPQGQPQYAAYDPYTDYSAYPAQGQESPYTGAGQDTYAGAGTGQYDYGTDQQQYAAYSDPYIGTTAGTQQYGTYGGYGHDENYDSYGNGQQFADPYAQQPAQSQPYAPDTPPGGVWVPQQREGEQYPPMPPEQPAQPTPYPNGYDTGYNDQYRY
ncbi:MULTISPECIES: hypothetical protein [unclassified Streptomyces]|uniref:hypothetical protein n=1 Tax=unclassified Streptomyces TaxID=2593676 RepID=UPI002DD7ED32|nr:hypothetical protein [Streptomyces sp. NBC_01257]WRZ64366.1 hypothetical protein OG408_10935 [Streptomyces sp. NBC_01257]